MRSGWYTRRSCCHPEGPQQVREVGQQKLIESHEENCRALPLERNSPRHQAVLGAAQLESSLAEKGLGVLVGTNWTWASNVPLLQRRLMASWAALGKALPTGQASLYSALERPHLEHLSSASLLSTGETWTYWRDSNEVPQRWSRARSISLMTRVGTVHPREDLGGILSIYISTWKKGTKKTEPGSFHWCPVTGQETAGTHENRRFLPNIRKHFFIVQVTEHWDRLPRGYRVSLLGDIQKLSEHGTCATYTRLPCLSRAVGPEDLQRCLPTLTILWFFRDSPNLAEV